MYSYCEGTTTESTVLNKKKRRKHLSPTRQQQKPKHEIPLEERLKEVLASTSSYTDGPATKSDNSVSVEKAEELVVLLIKGLHTSDAKLIDEALNTNNPDLVKACIRRLPVQSLLPLLREISHRIRSRIEIRGYIRWLHMVLSTHTAYLSSVPEIVDELCNQHQLLESRVSMMDRFLRLQGRLGLILEHFADKKQPHDRRELSSQAAKAVFIEESEPEEELDLSPTDDQGDLDMDWDDLKWSDEEDEMDEKGGVDEDAEEIEDEEEHENENAKAEMDGQLGSSDEKDTDDESDDEEESDE